MRASLRSALTLLVFATLGTAPSVIHAQTTKAPTPAAAPIVGVWNGSAKSDAGEMKIEVKIEQAAGKFTGSISTAHGNWTIVSATVKDDVWTVTFSRGDEAGTGTMTGKIVNRTFAGAWDNSPMAVGTFEVVK